jgi:hypothetical protein
MNQYSLQNHEDDFLTIANIGISGKNKWQDDDDDDA